MSEDLKAQIDAVETAIWRELSRRRWFGRHVEDEEMEALEDDLYNAIKGALEAVSR